MSIERPLEHLRFASHAGSSAHAERKRHKMGKGYWFSGAQEVVAFRTAMIARTADVARHMSQEQQRDARLEWMFAKVVLPAYDVCAKRKRETHEVQEAFEMARESAASELHVQEELRMEDKYGQLEQAVQAWRVAQPFLRPEPDLPGYHQCATHRCNDCLSLMSKQMDPKEKRKRKQIMAACKQCAIRTCRQVQLEVRCYAPADAIGDPHLCVLDLDARHTFCQSPRDQTLHRAIRWTERDVFMCSITGRAHYCGARCQLGIRTKGTDFLYMCPITGVSDARDARMLDTFGRENGQEDVQPNEYMREPTDDVHVIPTMPYITGEWLERLVFEAHDWTTINTQTRQVLRDLKRHDDRLRHLIVCLARVWSMFCPARYAQDMQRMLRVKKSAKAVVDRYVQQCHIERQRSQAPVPLSLQTITTLHNSVVYNKRFSPPLERHGAAAFVLARARTVLKLWYVVRTVARAVDSERKRRELPIGGFVEAAMCVLATGIVIPATDRQTTDVVVLHPDASLQMLLPDDTTMQRVSALDTSKCSRTRNEITESIKHAVLHGVPAHRFDLSVVELERMDRDVFGSHK